MGSDNSRLQVSCICVRDVVIFSNTKHFKPMVKLCYQLKKKTMQSSKMFLIYSFAADIAFSPVVVFIWQCSILSIHASGFGFTEINNKCLCHCLSIKHH